MICRKCNNSIENLLFNEYICVNCNRERWNKNRLIRKEKGLLKVNKMTPEYHSEYIKKWTLKNKHKILEYSKKARLNNPEKYKARYMLNSAVKSGVVKKEPCINCGDLKSEAHHENYNNPIDVIWVCRKHHLLIHNKKATE